MTEDLKGQTIVLWSGGWESTYCMLRARSRDTQVVGVAFDYGQEYGASEREALHSMHNLSLVRGFELPFVWLPSPVKIERVKGDRIFPMRNALFIALAAAYQPREIHFGSRNLLPFMDRYHDSNWWWGKAMGRAHRVKVRMPCTGMSKAMVIDSVRTAEHELYLDGLSDRVFSSEGL